MRVKRQPEAAWWWLALLLLTSLGCRAPVRVEYATPTAAAVRMIVLPAAATSTPLAPTPMPLPTATPRLIVVTATPTPNIPTLTLNDVTAVRLGPGLEHALFDMVGAGSVLPIVGRSADGGWWQISYAGAPNGFAWVLTSAGTAHNTGEVPLAAVPAIQLYTAAPVAQSAPSQSDSPPADPLPALPPPTPAFDFSIVKQRLWSNEENGGVSFNGSANSCGFGHEIYITVIDAAGRPLDGVIIADTYDNPRQITGSMGPGRAQYVLFTNGYNLFVAEDQNAGRPVTSEISQVMSAKDPEIPIPWLINAHYCADEAECEKRVREGGLCWGHYSFDITFQRSW